MKIISLNGQDDFSKFLKDLRTKGKFTQQQLSKKIGVTWQTVYNWERKHSFPSKAKLQSLAETLQIPLTRLSKIKNRFVSERLRRQIADCKDPVVSSLGPVFVPLLDRNMKFLPLEAIRHPEKWSEKRCFVPSDLFAGSFFAFEIGDRKMEPDYRLGDIVIADLVAPVKDHSTVIAKVKGYPATCRVFHDKGQFKILCTPNEKEPDMRLRGSDLEWCYAVIRNAEEG